jgi:hypothetical protein
MSRYYFFQFLGRYFAGSIQLTQDGDWTGLFIEYDGIPCTIPHIRIERLLEFKIDILLATPYEHANGLLLLSGVPLPLADIYIQLAS